MKNKNYKIKSNKQKIKKINKNSKLKNNKQKIKNYEIQK